LDILENLLPAFVRTYVLGLGFGGGIWLSAVLNPEHEEAKTLIEAVNPIIASLGAFIWLAIPFLILSLFIVYRLGGCSGLIAVGIAFVGGTVIFYHLISSMIITGIAVVIGIFSWFFSFFKD